MFMPGDLENAGKINLACILLHGNVVLRKGDIMVPLDLIPTRAFLGEGLTVGDTF